MPSDFFPAGRAAPTPVIAGYVIYREIHRGGQGVVYEALQTSTNRKVAIKMLLDDRFASEAAKRRFEREVKLVAQLHHANIIAIHDSGLTADGRCYYVMDYVPGSRTLRQYVQEDRLPLERALALFAEVCAAVEHAHRRGVIHRDLKPSNIMVSHDGVPVVLDFGLAKSMGATVETLVSMSGQLIGTWPYMSPEQTRARPDAIDARSDVYALGVVLYELLTGRFPYPIAGTLEEVLKTIRETPPELPSRKWNASLGIASPADGRRPLDDKLDAILLKALSKEPERRYASAADLAEDLQRYLRGEAVAARRDRVTYILRKRGTALARQYSMTTYVVAVLVTALLTTYLVVPFVYSWTPLNRLFQTWVPIVFPRSSPGPTFENVRIVAHMDDTDFETLARDAGIVGVTASVPQSRRRVHGDLMRKLASSGCRVVVWDFTIPGETAFDDAFVAGVRALRETGVEVVAAADGYWLEKEGHPNLSRNLIAAEVRPGSNQANLSDREPWALLFVAQRGGFPMPSLALAAFAAYQHPGKHVDFNLDMRAEVVDLVYWTLDSANPWDKRQAGEPNHLKLTAARTLGEGDPLCTPQNGLLPGDRVGWYELDIPSESALDSSTLSYQQVFTADSEQLREWFQHRAVVIGDKRENRDVHSHPDGRKLHGCYAHAAALDAVLRGVFPAVPRWLGEYLLPIAGAAAGCFTVLALKGGAMRRYVGLAIWTVLVVAVGAVAYRFFNYLFNPLVPLFALWGGFAAATICRTICGSRIA